MKVRVNSLYTYDANGYDLCHAIKGESVANGSVVRVINLPGAPPANTMRMCYIANPTTGQFLRMVDTSSLTPYKAAR